MGVNFCLGALLAKAKWASGVQFTSCLTIGRLGLTMSGAQATGLLNHYGVGLMSDDPGEEASYADQFLKTLLDAKALSSLDYSDYQGAEIVHDLNRPLPPGPHDVFDAVIDGGSLEHVFDVRTALSNYMRLVKTGGSLFICTAANNHMGHGFYQFSPEFFYRALSEENGFTVRDVILVKHPYPSPARSSRMKFYCVRNPSDVGARVGLVTRSPILIMVHAVKQEAREPFAAAPIQSDYRQLYLENSHSTRGPSRTGRRGAAVLKSYLPIRVRSALSGAIERMRYSLLNRSFYSPWSPW